MESALAMCVARQYCSALFSAVALAHEPPRRTPVCSGLAQPVEILRDRWGISHIYARNEHDLFFAQGFNVARDRLFQLELWRRQATGTLAEIQGPRALCTRHRGPSAEVPGRHDSGAEPLSSPGRGDRHRLRRGHQRLHRADRARAGTAAARVPDPGDQARQVDARGRRLPPQRPVSERRPRRCKTPSSSIVWGAIGPRACSIFTPAGRALTADPSVDLSLIGEPVLETLHGVARPRPVRPEDVEPRLSEACRRRPQGRHCRFPTQALTDATPGESIPRKGATTG